MINILSVDPYNFFAPLLTIVFLSLAVIISLDCVWRTKARLDTFMKLLCAGFATLLVKNILQLISPEASATVLKWISYLDALAALLLMFAAVEVYKIIRRLDNEQQPDSRPQPQIVANTEPDQTV